MSTDLAKQVTTLRQWLAAPERQTELEKALPKGLTPAHFTRVVMTATLRNPRIAECSLESIWLAVMESAQAGLELDGRQAALVPFKGTAKFIPMYQGLIQAAYKHPRVQEIRALPVFNGEHFRYGEGLKTTLEHIPGSTRDPSDLIAAYAVARVAGTGHVVRVMFKKEIDAHRARSRAKDDGPWVTDYVEMAVKTPIRMLAKMIPQSSELQIALSADVDPETEAPAGEPPVPHVTSVEGILDAIAADQREERSE